MADYEMLLKRWGPVEADYQRMGGLVLSRYFAKYPGALRMFPSKFAAVPPAERARDKYICDLGAGKLRRIHDILKTKGDHMGIVKGLATRHAKRQVPFSEFKLITEVIAEVLGEKAGLDGAGQRSLKSTMNVVYDDYRVVYKELGLPV